MQHNRAILRSSALGLAFAMLVVGVLSASAVSANSHEGHHEEAAGSVYTTTNDATANAVLDRKSTRLNSSHTVISYAVFCLKKQTSAPGSLMVRQDGSRQCAGNVRAQPRSVAFHRVRLRLAPPSTGRHRPCPPRDPAVRPPQ